MERKGLAQLVRVVKVRSVALPGKKALVTELHPVSVCCLEYSQLSYWMNREGNSK